MAEDLSRVSLGSACQFVESDGLTALPPNQYNLVADIGLVITDIDHELIHTNRPCNRIASVPEQNAEAIGKYSSIAIAIANGDGDHAALLGRAIGVVIANPLACCYNLEI